MSKKRVFHQEVDEQGFIDELNRIVNEAKSRADFSDSATNYAALAAEKYAAPKSDSAPSYIPPVNYFEDDNSEEQESSRHFPVWLKVVACIAAASVALIIIYNTGLLIPLGLIGLATGGLLGRR